jgi:hypothetical protein
MRHLWRFWRDIGDSPLIVPDIHLLPDLQADPAEIIDDPLGTILRASARISH